MYGSLHGIAVQNSNTFSVKSSVIKSYQYHSFQYQIPKFFAITNLDLLFPFLLTSRFQLPQVA